MTKLEQYIEAAGDDPIPTLADGERYMKATSAKLKQIMDELCEIEARRVQDVKRTSDLIQSARDFGYERQTVNRLEALTYNTDKTLHIADGAYEYLMSKMYQEKPAATLMPGMTTGSGMMPGLN